MKIYKNSVICVTKLAVQAWDVAVRSCSLLLRKLGVGVVVGLFHICWKQYVKMRVVACWWRS